MAHDPARSLPAAGPVRGDEPTGPCHVGFGRQKSALRRQPNAGPDPDTPCRPVDGFRSLASGKPSTVEKGGLQVQENRLTLNTGPSALAFRRELISRPHG